MQCTCHAYPGMIGSDPKHHMPYCVINAPFSVGNGGTGGSGGSTGGGGGSGTVYVNAVYEGSGWVRPRSEFLQGFIDSGIRGKPEIARTMEVLGKMLPKMDEAWSVGQAVCVIQRNRPPSWYKVYDEEGRFTLRADNELAEAEANLFGLYVLESEK